MTCEIIDFKTRHSALLTDDEPRKSVGTQNTIGKNECLRAARKEAWRKADALTHYCRARLEFTDAVMIAKGVGVKEVRAETDTNMEDRWSILENYRYALGVQLLTPAPDVASVNWKRTQLNQDYIGVKHEVAEKAIAEDVAFLDAHPTRNSRQNKQRKGKRR